MYSYAFELILLKIITRGRVHWFCMKVLKATEFVQDIGLLRMIMLRIFQSMNFLQIVCCSVIIL